MAEILADGKYTIEVALEGGSGKANINSPAELTVTGGKMQAEIVWNSSNYDYMKIGDEEYYPVNKEGNSEFLIDVEFLDSKIPILAETVAMSSPHTIEYTIYFDSSTAKSCNDSSTVGIISGILASAIVLTAILIKLIKGKKNNA